MIEVLSPSGSAISSTDLADWAELVASMNGGHFKRGDFKSAVDGAESNAERLVEGAWAALERRALLLGSSWPFSVDSTRLRWRGGLSDHQQLIYQYFSAMSYSSLSGEDRVLFERIVLEVMKHRFRGAAFRLGHPAIGAMPSSLGARINVYKRVSKLKDLEIGIPPYPQDKDLGLDVVSWYPFADERGGNVHILVQCATGLDWSDKDVDVNLLTLREHISWASQPVRLLCLPRCITMDEARWLRVSRSAGAIMDRTRIVHELDDVVLAGPLYDAVVDRLDALVAV